MFCLLISEKTGKHFISFSGRKAVNKSLIWQIEISFKWRILLPTMLCLITVSTLSLAFSLWKSEASYHQKNPHSINFTTIFDVRSDDNKENLQNKIRNRRPHMSFILGILSNSILVFLILLFDVFVLRLCVLLSKLAADYLGAHPREALSLSLSANWMYSCRERLCIVTERFFWLECWVCFRWPYSWFSTKTSLSLAGNNLTFVLQVLLLVSGSLKEYK